MQVLESIIFVGNSHLWITEKQVLVGVVLEQKVIVVECRPAKNYLKDVLVVFKHPLLIRARRERERERERETDRQTD